MLIVRYLDELAELPAASVLTIGNFDGVHLAHQRLLECVVERARSMNAIPVAISFEPHPLKILIPEHAPRLLTSLAQKKRPMEELGIELLAVLAFTRELASFTPAEFVRRILVEKFRPVAVLVGPNFRFGCRQSGDPQVLKELSAQHGYKVEVLPMLMVRGERVSSSRIRELVSQGRVTMAGRLLGRPFSNRGAIVRGLGVGKKLTVPTLNLAPVEELLPKVGVYVSRTRLGNTLFESVSNVGFKPTFGSNRLTVESFLLNFTGGVHESEMEVEYLHRLRDEMKFPSPAALKAQIERDARRARKYFRLLARGGRTPCAPTILGS